MNSYHILELVGEGSFGRVHKGMKKFTGQVVALKFMPKMGRSNKELQSLKKEIDIMSNLRHPNIVKLFDSFETETEVVVVTEYAEGQLFQIIEDDGSLPESRVCEIACQLVSALYYLHSRRILHRDMKPQNILFDKNGVVKLCDFGFARAMSVSTMVLTSIKGTPLYMSPELVAEKPYDHTADLWALGCILYELHTGMPPFYTNSIFHLVQIIVKDPIKWPDTMSSTCMSFLKGLLTKDPQKRLSWPDLLHHPFVADGVLVIPDTGVFSPLTVTPDPDMLARKLKQMAEKMSQNSGESKILRKVKEQRSKGNAKKPADSAKVSDMDELKSEETGSALTVAPPRDTSAPSIQPLKASPSEYPKNLSDMRSTLQKRGPITQDYEREFPSIEIGPRLNQRASKHEPEVTAKMSSSITSDSEDFWQKLVEESDPRRRTQYQLNYSTVIVQLKSTILVCKQELDDGVLKEMRSIRLPLKVLQNLVLTSDLAMRKHISRELGLPYLLIDLVDDSVENSRFIEQPWSLPTLGEMIVALVIYIEKNHDGLKTENRHEHLIKPFMTILNQAELNPLAPLAAGVLSLFSQHEIAVKADVNRLISLLKELVPGSCQAQLPRPPGWGLCDGLLALLRHSLSEHDDGSLCCDALVFDHLWEGIGTALTKTKPDMDFCSTNGLHLLLSVSLLVFSKDPSSYISLFSESKSTFVSTLGWLLSSECSIFTEGHPDPLENRQSLIELSCHFLCLPFALDLNSHSRSRILQLYDNGGVVRGLLRVIQTLPVSLVELPLSLLRCLLLRDRQRFVFHLSQTAGVFFSTPALTPSGQQTTTRTASSLLSDLLQLDELGDSAVELLSLLYLITRFCPHSGRLRLHIELSVLQRALTHAYDPVRAATCKVLGNLYPFGFPALRNLQLDIFKSMIDLLEDSTVHVRQAACLSIGKWLGYIAVKAGEKGGKCNGNGGDTPQWLKLKHDEALKASNGGTIKNKLCDDEMRQWLEEARMTAATLASLTSDPDTHTRLHACAALGNLLHVPGAVPELLEESVSGRLLRAACADSHNVVREAAIATLNLYTQQEALRQVLISLDARGQLLQAQRAPLQCDYLPLLRQLQTDKMDSDS